MIQPSSSFVDVDDIRLHYLAWDPERINFSEYQDIEWRLFNSSQGQSDAIPIVLLHGLGATAHAWRLVAERLCSHRYLVAFDQRGHGLSDQPEDGYDLMTMSEDVIRGMAALGLGQVALVGHGWGARVALVLAARHPALVSHLILVDCPHVEPRHWPGMTRQSFIHEQAPQEMYLSRASFLDAIQREMASFWSPAIEEIVLTYIRTLPDGRVEERLRPEHQQQIRASLWEDRALSYYSKLSCPVLLVPAAARPRRKGKPPERLENANEFALAKGYMAAQVERMIRHCTVLWMPDTAHDIQLQRPERLAKEIAEFVDERSE